MNQVTLQLPKTLYRNLEILAEEEAVSLTQYIVYILTRQITENYAVRVISDEDIAKQKTALDSLLKKWGKTSPAEIDKILDKRESAEGENELTPNIVNKLQARIASSSNKHT